MGFYDRYILPRMLDLTMGMKPIMRQRAKVVPLARGRVLEIGIGSGLNLSFYDKTKVDKVLGLDPSPELAVMAKKRAAEAGIDVDWLTLSSEKIPLPDSSVDSIVITYTMCTIPDVHSALLEMRRYGQSKLQIRRAIVGHLRLMTEIARARALRQWKPRHRHLTHHTSRPGRSAS